MRIVYIQNNVNTYELPHSMEIPKSRISREYDITQKEATEYIHYLIRKLSFNEFIKLCINKTTSVEVSLLSSFAIIQREPNLGKESLTPSNSYDAIVVLLDDFLRANNISKLLAYYKNKLNAVEEFTIEFDVNAYESSRQLKSIFKDIKDLSLGQKVVTILNLILSHGPVLSVSSGRRSLIGTGRILHCCPPANPGLTGVPSHIFTKKQKIRTPPGKASA